MKLQKTRFICWIGGLEPRSSLLFNPYTGFYHREYDNVGFMNNGQSYPWPFLEKKRMTLAEDIEENIEWIMEHE